MTLLMGVITDRGPPCRAFYIYYIYIYKLENKAPQQKTRPTRIPHPTSIPKNIHTHPAYKHTYKTKQKQKHKTKQTQYNNTSPQTAPQTAPQKTAQKKYITLYNSKYCIR